MAQRVPPVFVQVSATGVGGIIRDVFTMGARPVFSLDSLRFGPIRGDTAQHKWNRSRFAGRAECCRPERV